MSDHHDYLNRQRRWASMESQTPRFVAGQQRFLDMTFRTADRAGTLLDLGCGDGTGLRHLRGMGFTRLAGTDLCADKLSHAAAVCPVVLCDFHYLPFGDRSFDFVYASHSLEHARQPARVVAEARRVLKGGGQFFVVLPYPDVGDWNEEAHAAKHELGTDVLDGGEAVVRFLERHGLVKVQAGLDNFRESEVWLHFRKE